MAYDNMHHYQDERKLHQAENEQAEGEADFELAPAVAPSVAAGMLKGPMATAQRLALVQNVGQHYGNKQVQRMLGTARRSASSGAAGGPLEQDLSQRIQSERSSGQPLDTGVRRMAEQSLGHDLSRVRVHTGDTASELNTQMGAKAFTTGRDVFLGANTSPSDSGLMMHELTHTVQQGMSEDPPGAIGAADTDHEHAAEQASMMASGGVTGVQRESAAEDELQMMRDPEVQRESENEEEL